MASELRIIEYWLGSVLSGDSALTAMLGTQPVTVGGKGVFNGAAPQDAVFPAVIYRWIGPFDNGDLYANGVNRVWTGALYEVVVTDARSDYRGLGSADNRLDMLLSIPNVVSIDSGDGITGNINFCRRVAPFHRSSFLDGKNYRELGGQWHIKAQGT